MPTPTTDGFVKEVPEGLQPMVEKLAEQLLGSQKNEITILKEFKKHYEV